jgi:DNA-binding transcriptional MerR regulator
MLKIGDFARFTGVTIKTLHHYDDIGLLKPAQVDRFSGYRYYSVEQMDRLNRILALKDLGFSLDQISLFVDQTLPVAEIRGMLKLRQVELEEQIAETETRLNRVEARLQMIEQEGQPQQHEVVVKSVDAVRVLSYREVVPDTGSISPFFLNVATALEQNHIVSTGPWMALYHQGDFRQTDLDLEAAIPVAPVVNGPIPLSGDREMTIRILPAELVATVMCRMCQQVDVYETSKALWDWIEQNGYRILDSPSRELYFDPPHPPDPVLFEIQLAVEHQ